MSNENENESEEYYTVLELLQSMSFKKVLLILFGFYLFVFTSVMSFMYWYLKR